MYGPGTKFEKAMFYTRGPKEKQLLVVCPTGFTLE